MDPITQQLIAALAASILPLVGKGGVQAAQLIPALEGILSTVQGLGKTTYTVDDIVAIVSANTALAGKTQADIDAMP